MSYDIGLRDPQTGDWAELPEKHHMQGGCITAEFNITYNYSEHLTRVLPSRGADQSIRTLYGLTGAESIPMLERAIGKLGDDVDPDYWKATEGNAKAALECCLELARLVPEGIWDGD